MTESTIEAEVPVKNAKAEVRELLDGLPDEASIEDIQYHIYVRQKIQKQESCAQHDK